MSTGYGDPGTRGRILEAAKMLITERGGSAKLGDIADRAGVSRQTVYLHFGDRTGLLLALVQHMDQALALEESLAHVLEAATGTTLIERVLELHSRFSPAVDPVARVLESAQYDDVSLGKAWRDRMRFRRRQHGLMIDRLIEGGELAEGWDRDQAADLLYVVTSIAAWRELTLELGWSAEDYVENMTRLLSNAFLRG